jgi:uncharacterized membrane protein YdjX (TVP38/TMEM64 family)
LSARRRLLALAVLAAIVAAWCIADPARWLGFGALRGVRADLASWYARAPAFVVALYVAFDVALCALCIPGGALVSVAGGALFGWALGTVCASCATSAGAVLAFLGARHLFRDAVRERLGARLAAIDAGVARDGARYLFSLRLLPLVPFVLINPAMGLTAMPTRTFWLVSQLGMLPATLVYVNAGTQLGRLESWVDVLSPRVIASLALLAALPWLARLARRGPRG